MVDQARASPNRKLREGQRISVELAELPARSQGIELVPSPIPLSIVYEDGALLVVNKPAGLVTHPAPGHWQDTLVNALVHHFSLAGGTERLLPRAGIVHRLDKDTSGLLLVAKTDAAHTTLSRQLKARVISRTYLALVEGHVPLDHGTVSAAIGRHPTHRKEMAVRHLGGRDAVTHYRVLARSLRSVPPAQGRLPQETIGLRYSVLEVSLETGRTHQIRIHMAHVGHPIIGDLTYGRRSAAAWEVLGAGRQLLHAHRLACSHPVSGAPLTFTAQVPADLAGWLPEPLRRRFTTSSAGV